MAQVISNYDQIGRLVGTATANQAIIRNAGNTAWELAAMARATDIPRIVPGFLASTNYASIYTPYSGSDGTLTSQRLLALPFFFDRVATIAQLQMVQVSNGAASTVHRMGLYSNGATGLPDTLLADGGTAAADTGGTVSKSFTINYTLTSPGVYWVALVTNSGGNVQRTGATATGPYQGTDGNRTLPYRTSSHDPTTSLPASFGSVTMGATNAAFPRMYITTS